jgi:dihydropteroate synthase-like protein
MKILIITGKLASSLVKKVSSQSRHEVFVYTMKTPIAAFLTPQKIIRDIKSNVNFLKSIDIIITPGLIRKNVSSIQDEMGIPTYKGPIDAADIPVVLELIEKLDLSSQVPADKLIEDELKERALMFINNFEKNDKNIKKLLKKPENIMVGKLPVGEDFPMRVLAEIANAPLLNQDELLDRAEYFVKKGADMLDIGMIAGENLENNIPEMVKVLKENMGDIPISIDTLNPTEIEVAVESGVDLILSLDLGNCDEIIPLIKEKKIPAVILPTDFSKNWTPRTIIERVNAIEELMKKCNGINVIADLILDPINSQSIVESIISCYKFKKRNKVPLFFGVGNVTELLDVDSVGVNALLSGIAMELDASILFTPEASGKTLGSVHELLISSKMMFLAKNRGSAPKDLGINLLILKDKRKREKIIEDINTPIILGVEDYKFKQDPCGSFKLMVEDDVIRAVHYKNMNPNVSITGETAKQVYDTIIKQGLVSRVEHAAYLGAELQKAEISLKLGKNYLQDFPLFKLK